MLDITHFRYHYEKYPKKKLENILLFQKNSFINQSKRLFYHQNITLYKI